MGSCVKFKSNRNALKDVINNQISNSSFSISCPNCEREILVSGSQFGSNVICSFCHTNIFLDNTGMNSDINHMQRTFDNIFK